jgi:anti-sigma regulatory factor (Ser/Thr protein kinase)
MIKKSEITIREFEIKSDFSKISEVVKSIVSLTSANFKDKYMYEVAVYEAIFNAIEHGNLEITRSKKQKMIEEGTYDDFLKNVSSIRVCNERKVKIKLKKTKDKVEIKIKDQGKGFNWEEKLENAELALNSDPEQFHGYGIRIILNVFDKAFYNKPGNQLTLIKKFENPGG